MQTPLILSASGCGNVKKYLQASWCCNMVGLMLAQSVTFWASVEQQTGLKNTSRQHIVSLTWGQRTRRLSGGRCVNPSGTRLCCDVESTSLTLIQRRNNVCAQWKISTGQLMQYYKGRHWRWCNVATTLCAQWEGTWRALYPCGRRQHLSHCGTLDLGIRCLNLASPEIGISRRAEPGSEREWEPHCVLCKANRQ